MANGGITNWQVLLWFSLMIIQNFEKVPYNLYFSWRYFATLFQAKQSFGWHWNIYRVTSVPFSTIALSFRDLIAVLLILLPLAFTLGLLPQVSDHFQSIAIRLVICVCVCFFFS